jgi:hypothetical protein
VLVDDFMADLQFAFELKPIGGLFWTEVSWINLSTFAQLSDENCLLAINTGLPALIT